MTQSIEISDVCQVDGVRHVILAIWISSLGGMVEGSGDVDAGWPAHQIVKIRCLTHLAFSSYQSFTFDIYPPTRYALARSFVESPRSESSVARPLRIAYPGALLTARWRR